MIAAEKNQNPEVITTLLKAGAGLNDESTEVATPLMYAARNPNPEVVSVLLKAGAKDRPNIPPGMAAVWTALMWAAGYHPNPEVIATLLKAGARIEEKDGDNETALLWAARYNVNRPTKCRPRSSLAEGPARAIERKRYGALLAERVERGHREDVSKGLIQRQKELRGTVSLSSASKSLSPLASAEDSETVPRSQVLKYEILLDEVSL